ncbi:uncharacterized protein BDZ99DRAFT_480046 [Mytilinidion resinicola]|uniref:Uncharacterized protein n=1 Tax=Mytilinidion resinicola TaxID=574789 RepID=A0A6A6YD73_9PEZI|nr:uncharacterized protein BDZ99DRAFT_480046 [Mytilinidion resinicola]KAF2806045.1 hypothetical protein BDZ99DRAFT_480046 [Mytilinidion resinicola]
MVAEGGIGSKWQRRVIDGGGTLDSGLDRKLQPSSVWWWRAVGVGYWFNIPGADTSWWRDVGVLGSIKILSHSILMVVGGGALGSGLDQNSRSQLPNGVCASTSTSYSPDAGGVGVGLNVPILSFAWRIIPDNQVANGEREGVWRSKTTAKRTPWRAGGVLVEQIWCKDYLMSGRRQRLDGGDEDRLEWLIERIEGMMRE